MSIQTKDEIVDIPEHRLRFFGGPGKMLLPSPATIAALIDRVPEHHLITTEEIRDTLADEFEVEGVCPVTTQKSLKALAQDDSRPVAYWRVIKANGELYTHFGVENQKARLVAEGFTIEAGRKIPRVAQFQTKLIQHRKGAKTMNTQPKIDTRTEQPYVGIRTRVALPDMPTVLPALFDEGAAWLASHHIPITKAPFIRYYVTDMAGKLDLEVGYPVNDNSVADERMKAGVLPAGQYASLVHIGPYDGLYEANRVLVDWAKDNGIEWATYREAGEEVFVSRFETYLTDPSEEPDASKWETEVAIRMVD